MFPSCDILGSDADRDTVLDNRLALRNSDARYFVTKGNGLYQNKPVARRPIADSAVKYCGDVIFRVNG